MILILDYGMGNSFSIKNMLYRVGLDSLISNNIDEINKAEKIIMPGVGAFDAAIENIEKLGIRKILYKKAKIEKIPILGICLGMQIFFNKSEEGTKPGLSWLSGDVKKFTHNKSFKVPHMGWNNVVINRDSLLTKNLTKESRYYFCHSYYVMVENNNSLLKTDYIVNFDSAVNDKNIFGVQFHPEKSHKFGKQILKNFGNL